MRKDVLVQQTTHSRVCVLLCTTAVCAVSKLTICGSPAFCRRNVLWFVLLITNASKIPTRRREQVKGGCAWVVPGQRSLVFHSWQQIYFEDSRENHVYVNIGDGAQQPRTRCTTRKRLGLFCSSWFCPSIFSSPRISKDMQQIIGDVHVRHIKIGKYWGVEIHKNGV